MKRLPGWRMRLFEIVDLADMPGGMGELEKACATANRPMC
jgi:hypothetical protein